jgi:hypothetical protein
MEVYIHIFLAFTLEGHNRSATLAVGNKPKDTLSRRLDKAQSRSEWGGKNKNLLPCLKSNLGYPAHSQNILVSWRHFIYPLLTFYFVSILPKWVNRNLIIYFNSQVKN